ncbi:MAG: ArnT family glycosyltransferase, partial [Candidatus Binatia bacterium]
MVIIDSYMETLKNAAVSDPPNVRRIKFAGFLVIVALLIIAAYFSPHIWHHGEAREALVIQDIVEHHHWVLPLRNSELPSKPILYHWLAATFALLIGLSDFTIRLPSVIGAAMMMWAT